MKALLVVVLAAGLGAGWIHQYNERLRAEGRYEILKASADSAAAVAAAKVAASSRRAQLAADSIAVLEKAGVEAIRRAEDAEARQPEAAEAIVAAAGPEEAEAVRARVVALLALVQTERAEFRERIRTDSLKIVEFLDLDVTRVAAIEKLSVALEAAQAVTAAAVESGPGWAERTVRKLAIPAAAVAGWVLRGLL